MHGWQFLFQSEPRSKAFLSSKITEAKSQTQLQSEGSQSSLDVVAEVVVEAVQKVSLKQFDVSGVSGISPRLSTGTGGRKREHGCLYMRKRRFVKTLSLPWT